MAEGIRLDDNKMKEVYISVSNLLKQSETTKPTDTPRQEGINESQKPKKRISKVFHYTSTAVLDNILAKGIFWATNLLYLNDAEEYKHGMRELNNSKFQGIIDDDILKRFAEKEITDGLEIYSISFSGAEDSLYQWHMYAKESGVCIALDKTKFTLIEAYYDNAYQLELMAREAKNEISSERTPTNISYACMDDLVQKVRYGVWEELKEQDLLDNVALAMFNEDRDLMGKERFVSVRESEEGYRKEFECFYKDFLFGDTKVVGDEENKLDLVKLIKKEMDYTIKFFQILCSYSKTNSFRAEEEYRAAFWFNKKKIRPLVKYQVRPNGIIRPYIEVTFNIEKESIEKENIEKKIIKKEPCIPVYEIIVGPSGKQQPVFDSVVHRIKYGSNKVWDYTNDEGKIKEKFEDYFNGVRKECQEDFISSQVIEETLLKKILVYLWLMEFNDDIKRNVNERNEKIDSMRKKLEIVETFKQLEEVFLGLDVEKKKLLQQIRRNHFFSKEGIWIKKSKIPFIFG